MGGASKNRTWATLPMATRSTTRGRRMWRISIRGKEQDASTGLYFYEARYYDPVLGRFLSADIIETDLNNPQTFNRYSYVLNNPIKYVDPTGEFAQFALGLVRGFFGGCHRRGRSLWGSQGPRASDTVANASLIAGFFSGCNSRLCVSPSRETRWARHGPCNRFNYWRSLKFAWTIFW